MTDSSLLGVLRLLDASPSRTQREMAQALGMSLGKANYLLQALLAKGYKYEYHPVVMPGGKP